MSVPALQAELTIPGFEIEGEIASGGMATVYLATQVSLNRQVALKMLRAFDDPEHKARFLNESRIIAGLNHRSIITIHDVGTVDERPFLSMEFLEGGDLATRLAAGPLDPCQALEIAATIADCLAFVHAQGIVHRDVKPANILFHRDGTPVLTDFGIATDTTADLKLTSCGTTVGSPCYVSPEQAQGLATSASTDIYSLGVVLYEMLAGRAPFQESSAVATMAAHLSTPPPRLPAHLSACQALIDRMLAKSPTARFATAGETAEAIRSVQLTMGDAPAPKDAMGAAEVLRALAASAVRIGLRMRRLIELNPKPAAAGAATLILAGTLWAFSTPNYPQPVNDQLRHAEAAMADDRLSYPKAGSAFFHYQEALALDPKNRVALQGLHEIAEIYADRVEQSLQERDFASAKFHLDRGLEVEPRNERLLELQEETKGLRSLPEKVVRGIRSILD